MPDIPEILLVPVDDSEGAGKAAALAARPAERLDVPLRLLCTFPKEAREAFGLQLAPNPREYEYFSPEAFAELRDRTAEQVFKAARDAMGEVGATVEQEVVPGIAAPPSRNTPAGSPIP